MPGAFREILEQLMSKPLGVLESNHTGNDVCKVWTALSVVRDCIGDVIPESLYWGSVENFAGLERPVVVLTGFHHPHNILYKNKKGHLRSTSRVDSLVRNTSLLLLADKDCGQMYLGVTRSKYRVAVVDTDLDEWLAHYAIRHCNEHSQIPHSGGTHNAIRAQGQRLLLKVILDFSLALPLGVELKFATMARLINVTPEAWSRQGLKTIAAVLPIVEKLDVRMGNQDHKAFESNDDTVYPTVCHGDVWAGVCSQMLSHFTLSKGSQVPSLRKCTWKISPCCNS